MKIGILAQYLDTRPDVKDMLNAISREHQVILFIRASETHKIQHLLNPAITLISIPAFNIIPAALSLIWQYLYLLFGKIPESKYNYFMTEHIKLLNPNLNKSLKFIQTVLLKISRFTPSLLDYDNYLSRLNLIKTPLTIPKEIDVFLCYSEICHDWAFAKILKEQKPVWIYVYSWDHPCKMKTFSKKAKYLVWHEGIKNDLITLQKINAEQIHILGATQFSYVYDFLNSQHNDASPFGFSYIYLGCATGYDALAAQESHYCAQIAHQLFRILPTWKLVLKPYPFLKNQEIYSPLKDLPNVIFDTSTSSNQENNNDDKFLKIKHAKAFFHFGTTMGYEAGYFKTPSFLIDLADPQKHNLLHGFVHQYQNDKYLNNGSEYNTIKNQVELIEVLKNLSANAPEKQYSNHVLQQAMPLYPLQTLAEKLISLVDVKTQKLKSV